MSPIPQSNVAQIFTSISVVTCPFRPILVTETGLIPAFAHRSFFHILVDEQLPELFITDRHKISPPYRYTKNALPPGRASGLYSHTAEVYYNTDSVVYYDSAFGQKKQENDAFT